MYFPQTYVPGDSERLLDYKAPVAAAIMLLMIAMMVFASKRISYFKYQLLFFSFIF